MALGWFQVNYGWFLDDQWLAILFRRTSARPRDNFSWSTTSSRAVQAAQGFPQPERLLKLNEIAITQMRTLLADTNLKRLK
jgi:hypothetical protein